MSEKYNWVILLKRIFILIYIPIIFFSFLILFSNLYGSPFYLLLTEKRIKGYIEKNYTTLSIDNVFYDGEYKAVIFDKYNDKYIMTYYPKTDEIIDSYYNETVTVMQSLYRNNIRQLLEFNNITLNVDNIIVELKIPKYIFEVGEIATGKDCKCNVTLIIDDNIESTKDFGKKAYTILKELRYSVIKIENILIIGHSDDGEYSISINEKLYPANEETTIFLTSYKKYNDP